MYEEYLVAKLMDNFCLPYNFAQMIVMDLDKRNLLNHFKLNVDKYEDFCDIFNTYYKNYITK